MVIKWIRRLNDALLGLIIGILLYGLAEELIGIWFVQDKVRYTIGVIIGIACAVGMAIHLALVIEESVRIGEGHSRLLSFKSVMRYVVVCAVLGLTALFNLGNLYAAIIGLFGLKVSAYAQPYINKKLFKKSQEENELLQEETQNN